MHRNIVMVSYAFFNSNCDIDENNMKTTSSSSRKRLAAMNNDE